MANALKFRNTQVPRQTGEQARLKVVSGPDYGATYVVLGTHAVVGRGEDSDIVISDLKSSRKHAELSLTQEGWKVRDLGSANGILLNGKQVRDSALRSLDSFTVGETTLEFVTADANTVMLKAPARKLVQSVAEQAAFVAQREKIRSLGGSSGKSGGGSLKAIPLLLVVGAGAWMFLGEPPKKSPMKPLEQEYKDQQAKIGETPSGVESRDLASFLPENADPEAARTSEQFYREGFREYREKNYLRAKGQFEMALQISPSHRLARLYLENCDLEIQSDVKGLLERGKKSYEAGKLRDARAHYEQVMRLLFRDQSNPSFVEARDQLEKVSKDMEKEDKG